MHRFLMILLLLIMGGPVLAQAPSPWFRQAEPCILKGVDGLASVGVGYSFAIYTWTPDRAAWLDVAPYFNASRQIVGGFAGLSTEIEKVPIFEVLLKPLQADCVGAGVKFKDGHARGLIYGSWHF